MKRNPTRALAVAAGLVIVALTAAAFWLSYAHLAEVAEGHGMRGKDVRAWAWPACLDLFIMAGELMWLRAAMLRRVDWWAICLTAAGSGGSIALNVAGVGSNADPLSYVVAAVPPTAALLAFGALMRQIHQALTGHVEPDEVTIERVDDDQPSAPALERRPLPEVVPAGTELLPIVARPEPVQVTTEEPPARPDETRVSVSNLGTEKLAEVVTPRFYRLDSFTEQLVPDVPSKMTSAVPAETPRRVVTEVVTLTPSELRRRASKLNRELVTSTGRQVTIDRLREEFNLSRREAAELRRQVVTSEPEVRS